MTSQKVLWRLALLSGCLIVVLLLTISSIHGTPGIRKSFQAASQSIQAVKNDASTRNSYPQEKDNTSTSALAKGKETVLNFIQSTFGSCAAGSHKREDVNSLRYGDIVHVDMPDVGMDMHLNREEYLVPGAIPPNVFFIWCGHRWFEFKHFLSVLSAIRAIQPDKFYFYYEHEEPKRDKMSYHMWFDELKRDYPFFLSQQITVDFLPLCRGTHAQKEEALVRLLSMEGGLYIGPNTWLVQPPTLKHRLADVTYALADDQLDGYLLMRAGSMPRGFTLSQWLDSQHDNSSKVSRSSCSNAHHLYQGATPKCVIVKGKNFDQFYPMNIWDKKDNFSKVARKIFYGTERVMLPRKDSNNLVPNIGHMIWIGGGEINFVFYLSALSMLNIMNVEVLYLHGNTPPSGHYWRRLIQDKRVKFITRSPPSQIYQGQIQPWFRALMSDIIRVDLMIKWGGIYADTDAIWVKPLTLEDRSYDVTASYDWVDWSWPYMDSVNFGLSYGKKNAKFWRIFRDSMRHLNNDLHGFTGVMMPYKLLERRPDLLRIDRHLQVICYYSRCHPTYVPDYHNMSKDHTNMGYFDNGRWKTDVYAFHWTHPNPPELTNETTLANGNGIFADLGRYVLEKSGLLHILKT